MFTKPYRFEIWLYIFLFFSMRFVSLLTWQIPYLFTTISVFIILSALCTIFFRPSLVVPIIVTELFLGGNGALFSVLGISIRSYLLIAGIITIFLHHKTYITAIKRIPKHLRYTILVFLLSIAVSCFIGFFYRNSLSLVMADAIPFAYLFLLPLFVHEIHSLDVTRVRLYQSLLIAAIISYTIFTFLTFFLFSFYILEIHGTVYNWYRDILAAKITNLDGFFFRSTFPWQIFIPIIGLVATYRLSTKKDGLSLWWWILISSMAMLAISLTRTYILGYTFGLVVLWITFARHRITLALYASTSILVWITVFVCINLIVSAGSSYGLGLISERFGAIANPEQELSAYSRSELLEPIYIAFAQRPILGNGFGSTITITQNETIVQTAEYDWGWFELFAERGIIGGIIFMWFFVALWKQDSLVPKVLRHGVLSGFEIMYITAPVLHHVYGIFLICIFITLTTISKPKIFFTLFR